MSEQTPQLTISGPPGPLQRIVRDQRLLFLLVGGINTVASTALFAGLVLLLGDQIPSTAILAFVWVVSLLLVFVVYRRLVFRVRGNVLANLGRFATVNLSSLAINAALLGLFADVLGWPAIPVQVASTILVVAFNYVGHRHFSFRKKGSSDG